MKKSIDKPDITLWVIFAWIAISAGASVLWIMNIYKLVVHLGDPLTGLEVARIIGTFIFPIGVVLGFV